MNAPQKIRAVLTLAVLLLLGHASIGKVCGQGSQPTDRPILLDFTAEWCGPCRSMAPVVHALEARGLPVRAVDIDDESALAERYGVTGVPTFIVVDSDGRELGRTSGARPAEDLIRLYQSGAAQLARAAAESRPTLRGQSPDPVTSDEARTLSEAVIAQENGRHYDPWQTVVRIKVLDNRLVGFGSGTIIDSNENEALILTCAHIFHIDRLGRRQPTPSKFPLKVAVDLFDGQLRESNTKRRTPYMLPSITDIPAQVIDYDYAADVALIRIRTNHSLPFARVVPPDWEPERGMKMMTLGCSEGKNASAWSTYVTKPGIGYRNNEGEYRGTECLHGPIEGRSGGGLFTVDGALAGVCDFRDASSNNRGLYAAPISIHRMLERNRPRLTQMGLKICYAGPEAGRPDAALMAMNRDRRTPDRSPIAALASEPIVARGQSPDEFAELPIPSTDLIGVQIPADARLATLGTPIPDEPERRYRWLPVNQGLAASTDEPEPPLVPGGFDGRASNSPAMLQPADHSVDRRALSDDLFLDAPLAIPARNQSKPAAAPNSSRIPQWQPAGTRPETTRSLPGDRTDR